MRQGVYNEDQRWKADLEIGTVFGKMSLAVRCTNKYKLFCKKCLTSPCGSGIVNKLSQGIASEMLKNK